MKKNILFLGVLFFSTQLFAQFSQANLSASGLTCSLCSKAIFDELKRLPFVDKVNPDIESSSFEIIFKENASVSPDALAKAVKDAGFDVAKLKMKVKLASVKAAPDKTIEVSGNKFRFVNGKSQLLNGETEMIFVDKEFLTAKERKKHPVNNFKNERVYQVII